MFKNMAQVLKVTHQMKGDSKKADDETKKNKMWQNEAPNGDDETPPGEVVAVVKDEGFLVRQGRKKLSKLVARLQNVRSLAAMKQDSKKGKCETDSISESKNKTSALKDKVVKFKLDDGEVCASEKTATWQEDSYDDEDSFVSAYDTFFDYEGAKEANGSQCDNDKLEQQVSSKVARSDSEDELAGDKVILPEEQCDIPTFLHTKNCDPEIIEETRRLLKERFAKNPDSFYESDYKRMLEDDWTVTRFLLRRRLNPRRTAKLMEECGKFRRQYLMGEVQLWEFPIEFHLAGGLFKYARDRVGNVTMYMRVKMYRRIPEISDVFKAFILCVLEQCDIESNGRGTAVVFDLTGCGIQNVDLGFLYWLLNSFRNYCPKGVSYILVYNLPWFLSATAKLAMTWMSETNRRSLRFVQGKEIEDFIVPENLPDYLGGTCPIDYRAVPEGSRPAVEICNRMDISVEQALKIRDVFKQYLPENYEASIPPSPIEKGTVRHHQTTDEFKQYDSQTVPDNHSQGLDSTMEAGSVPVVELVSQASKFMSTN